MKIFFKKPEALFLPVIYYSSYIVLVSVILKLRIILNNYIRDWSTTKYYGCMYQYQVFTKHINAYSSYYLLALCETNPSAVKIYYVNPPLLCLLSCTILVQVSAYSKIVLRKSRHAHICTSAHPRAVSALRPAVPLLVSLPRPLALRP